MADEVVPTRRLNSDGAGPYIILVHGKLERHWEPELAMSVSYHETEQGIISTLNGQLPDQAALLGILGRLAMWGYLILSVSYEAGRAEDISLLFPLP